jgi:von Willebrand factor type A domain
MKVMDWLLRTLTRGQDLPSGSQEWMLGHDGLSPGWAFLIFLALGGACVWAYFRFAPELPNRWRYGLAALRAVAIAVFLMLLVKPVLHLTINEPVRQSLLVLLDNSQSMLLVDHRTTADDLKRAALASGLIDPAKGLNQDLPAGVTPEQLDIGRWELLEKLAANPKLNLWSRLQKKSDLVFYRFGRDASPAGTLPQEDANTGTSPAEAAHFFHTLPPEQPATAIGESLREVLEQNRGQAIGGVLLITDGANNGGLPPAEAARVAREENIPLFIYGVGVTKPIDLSLHELAAPRLAFAKEQVDVKVRLRTQGLSQKTVTAVLKANGKPVDEQKVVLTEDGDSEVTFHFVPEAVGELPLQASVPTLPEEIAKDNNSVEGKLRVMDSKIHVLYIEQEPRWDFRYLLAFLQRDRRLDVHCVLINGEPGLDKIPDSPFLADLPKDREGIFRYEILILGDVNPADLGETRMQLIREWVEQANGGMIFLAGPKFDPSAYERTPLEALLPIVPDTSVTAEQRSGRAKEPFKLTLTPTGEMSSYLRVADDPAENLAQWAAFSGVRWTASVAKAKPGAEVLLADGRQERAGTDGPMPVIAIQGYGSGECVFIGTDETYRWRSRTGEKHYAKIWGSIMQSLSLGRLEGASLRTQLKAERPRYFVGDKVVLSGKIFNEKFGLLTAGTLQGKLSIRSPGNSAPTGDRVMPLDVSAVDQPGTYRAEFTANTPGDYAYSTLQDPDAVVKFEVVEPKLEQMETALDEHTLKSMADIARGHFLREEDIDRLPSLVAEQTATVPVFKKFDLFHSPWWMILLFIVLFSEWLLRRLMQLK